MLEGAIRELSLGDPRRLATDVGPVIDADAQASLRAHVAKMRAAGHPVVELPFTGETAIFITPGYRFRAVDILLTNFHLPRSTLFMLVSAFSGLETMQHAYAHAIAGGYRFYSYGDACLLFRDKPSR